MTVDCALITVSSITTRPMATRTSGMSDRRPNCLTVSITKLGMWRSLAPSVLLPSPSTLTAAGIWSWVTFGGQLHKAWQLGGGNLHAQVAPGRSEVDDKNIQYAIFPIGPARLPEKPLQHTLVAGWSMKTEGRPSLR